MLCAMTSPQSPPATAPLTKGSLVYKKIPDDCRGVSMFNIYSFSHRCGTWGIPSGTSCSSKAEHDGSGGSARSQGYRQWPAPDRPLLHFRTRGCLPDTRKRSTSVPRPTRSCTKFSSEREAAIETGNPYFFSLSTLLTHYSKLPAERQYNDKTNQTIFRTADRSRRLLSHPRGSASSVCPVHGCIQGDPPDGIGYPNRHLSRSAHRYAAWYLLPGWRTCHPNCRLRHSRMERTYLPLPFQAVQGLLLLQHHCPALFGPCLSQYSVRLCGRR